jgi:5,10-methylenetetrahydromethanopterin reductase
VIEFGKLFWSAPFEGNTTFAEDEAFGFDIRYIGDNSCFASDPFAELRAGALTTSKIKLAVGCTNTVTRHPSVVATSIAAVQVLSGGRAICGIGKGDSAVAVIGRGPQRMDEFVENAKLLRAYLRGETTRLGEYDSRLEWLAGRDDYEPVPVEIMTSSPKTIRAAAAIADRITLQVGTAPERLDWALDLVDQGLADAGRTRADVQLGLSTPMSIGDDRAEAAERLSRGLAPAIHMASFPGHDLDTQPEILRRVTSKLRAGYDYAQHPRPGTAGAERGPNELIDAELADWYGLAGPVSYIVERFGRLLELGFRHFIVGARPADRDRLAEIMREVRTLDSSS